MRRLEWRQETKVPQCVAAAFDALAFDGAVINWPDVDPQAWEHAIYYLHRNQLTLILRHACDKSLPEVIQKRFQGFYQANAVRLEHLRGTTNEVISVLGHAGIETVLLKGFARAAEYVPDPTARMHYDIDLFCPQAVEAAARVLTGLGYQPIAAAESESAGHLAPLALPTSWKWREDFFDAETPAHVELHHRLWSPEFEQFPFSGLDAFWTRRESDTGYCTLSRHDTLAYRCMHLLRHLLRGDIRAAGVYEIAYFLHQNYRDNHFWATWQTLYSRDLTEGQAVCFALAQRWFGCSVHPVPLASIECLRKPLLAWMRDSAASPVESFFAPGKQELLLHFALVDSSVAKFRIALRRLVPWRHSPRIWEDRGAYLQRMHSRAVYHARALVPTLLKLLIIRR